MDASEYGFQEGYMNKVAFIPPWTKFLAALGIGAGAVGSGVGAAGAETAGRYLVPAFVAAPALAGIATGTLQSRITSPTKLDTETLQKAIVAAELEQAVAELKRRKALREVEEEEKSPEERSIHI